MGPSRIGHGKSEARRLGLALGLLLAGVACKIADEPRLQERAWIPLFDGSTLTPWRSIPFGGEGEIELCDGFARLPMGSPLTGLRYPAGLPVTNRYELEVEVERRTGTDFLCGLTFPVDESFATVILGGWGGALCGLSSLNGKDASENATKSFRPFTNDRIYCLRLRVEPDRLRAWLDGDSLFDVDTRGQRLSLRAEMLPSVPLGVASYVTTADLHAVRWRALDPRAD